MGELIRLADLWRDTGTERGFSMALGRLGDRLDGDCLLVEALTAEGECVGLLSLVPWGSSGASLDLMRRGPHARNGCVELMVTELAAAADGFGLWRLSLNFAVMRSVFEEGARIGAGPVLRLWRSLLVFSSRWWQLETLYRANAKYQPQWVPRFVSSLVSINPAATLLGPSVTCRRCPEHRPPRLSMDVRPRSGQ